LNHFTENAWKYYKNQYFKFLVRLADDFASDPFVQQQMFRRPNDQDEIIQYGYSLLLMHLAAIQPVEIAEATVGKLESLAGEFKENEGIQVQYAKGLFNLSNKQQEDEVINTLNRLEDLAASTNNKIIASYWLFDLIQAGSTDEEKINGIYNDLLEFVNSNSTHRDATVVYEMLKPLLENDEEAES